MRDMFHDRCSLLSRSRLRRAFRADIGGKRAHRFLPAGPRAQQAECNSNLAPAGENRYELHMALPDFSLLRRHYLDYERYPLPAEVRKLVGGEANDSDITNTCTIRMSHAMNEVGHPIPLNWDGV